MTLGTAGPALADGVLAAFAGDWTGEGWIRPGRESPREAARCAVAARYDGEAAMLDLAGRCAVAGGGAEVTVRLVDDGNGMVRAAARSPAFDQDVQFRGSLVDGTLSLASADPFRDAGATIDATLDIGLPDGGRFAMDEWHREIGAGEETQVLALTFTLREAAP